MRYKLYDRVNLFVFFFAARIFALCIIWHGWRNRENERINAAYALQLYDIIAFMHKDSRTHTIIRLWENSKIYEQNTGIKTFCKFVMVSLVCRRKKCFLVTSPRGFNAFIVITSLSWQFATYFLIKSKNHETLARAYAASNLDSSHWVINTIYSTDIFEVISDNKYFKIFFGKWQIFWKHHKLQNF